MFNESLSSKFDESFLSSINHFEKIRVKQSKHKRWNDQAWSEKRIHKNISVKRKIWNRIFRSHFTFRNKMQNTLLTSSQKIAFFERNILNFLQKKKLSKKKQFIIIMFSKKIKIKFFKLNKRLFSFIIVCYFKNFKHDLIFSWN
jgi:hypothetical protein